MKKTNILIFVLVVVVAVLAVSLLLQKNPTQETVTQQVVQTTPPTPSKQAIVHYPVPTVIPQQQQAKESAKAEVPIPPEPPLPVILPPVEQSDESIQEALKQLKIKESLIPLIFTENFIQRLVTTIDSLPEQRLPRVHLPIFPPKGRFVTSGTNDTPQTSRRNHTRYSPYIQLLETLRQDLVLKIYVHYYPLFQTAFEQLGYRNAYFNDRLINVIEHLLETPNPPEPMLLAQPAVLYVYADPLLEKLSSGQKTLLRIGPKHRQKVMVILKSYRDQLVSLKP